MAPTRVPRVDPDALALAYRDEPNVYAVAARLGLNYRTLERQMRDDIELQSAADWGRLARPLPHSPTGTGSCQCTECRQALSRYRQHGKRNRYRRGLLPDDPRHGTYTGYRNWGCRCDDCKAAGAAVNARRYQDSK